MIFPFWFGRVASEVLLLLLLSLHHWLLPLTTGKMGKPYSPSNKLMKNALDLRARTDMGLGRAGGQAAGRQGKTSAAFSVSGCNRL